MDNALPRRSLLRLGGLAGGSLIAGAMGNGLITSSALAASGPFTLNGFTVDEPFATYWQEHGALAQQGLPISPRFDEVSPTNGRTYSVQYFERARFEYHPENQPPYDVLLGLLGSEQFKAKYPGGQPGAAPPPPPPLRNGETLRMDGANLTVTMGSSIIGIRLTYTNTGPSREDFTVAESDVVLNDDLNETWKYNSEGFAKRYILDPNQKVETYLSFYLSRSNPTDRNLIFTVVQFGKVRGARWTATISGGGVK